MHLLDRLKEKSLLSVTPWNWKTLHCCHKMPDLLKTAVLVPSCCRCPLVRRGKQQCLYWGQRTWQVQQILWTFKKSLPVVCQAAVSFMARFIWLYGRNTEWTEAEGVTQGPEDTNIKEEPPTESRGSDWTPHLGDSLCNRQGHKATAERAWVTVGFSQISGQEWLTNFC